MINLDIKSYLKMHYHHLSNLLQTHHINRFALAVSGGADSMAMTKLALRYQKEHNSTIHALIVDHNLRPESQKEAAHVANLCQKLDVQHTILTWKHPSIETRLQERAREARYQLLSDWCKKNHYQYLLLGHHANDVLETFMMRLSKGSSLKGLCALKPLREMYGITLVRPFLSLPQKELHTALQGQEYVQDPSNDNTKFERVRLRQWLSQMDIMDGFLKSYQKLEDVDDTMMKLAQAFVDNHMQENDIELQALLDLDPCLFSYVIKTFVLDGWVDNDTILRLRQALSAQKVMTLNHKKFEVLSGRIVRVSYTV